jgi:hypothetical protein
MNNLSLGSSSKVQIYSSDLNVDPNLYIVESQNGNIISLKTICSFCNGVQGAQCSHCNSSGIGLRRKVHYTRVVKVFDSNNNIVYETSTKEKQMTVAKQKPEAAATTESIDFKSLHGELFSKQVKFDHTSIAVEAHVLIATDKHSFMVFNSYNRALGKKGRIGKSYPLTDNKTYERKVAQLLKQGYVKRDNLE